MHEYISNTSCLILLNKINRLDLLEKMYSRILITEDVKDEYADNIPAFIEIRAITNSSAFQALRHVVDLGEASTLALGMEVKNSTVILDDRKARKVARDLGLSATGTLGILLKAKERGLIPLVRSSLDDLKTSGMWISDEVVREMLDLAGERD